VGRRLGSECFPAGRCWVYVCKICCARTRRWGRGLPGALRSGPPGQTKVCTPWLGHGWGKNQGFICSPAQVGVICCQAGIVGIAPTTHDSQLASGRQCVFSWFPVTPCLPRVWRSSCASKLGWMWSAGRVTWRRLRGALRTCSRNRSSWTSGMERVTQPQLGCAACGTGWTPASSRRSSETSASPSTTRSTG
jgi:hypothetical protein